MSRVDVQYFWTTVVNLLIFFPHHLCQRWKADMKDIQTWISTDVTLAQLSGKSISWCAAPPDLSAWRETSFAGPSMDEFPQAKIWIRRCFFFRCEVLIWYSLKNLLCVNQLPWMQWWRGLSQHSAVPGSWRCASHQYLTQTTHAAHPLSKASGPQSPSRGPAIQINSRSSSDKTCCTGKLTVKAWFFEILH